MSIFNPDGSIKIPKRLYQPHSIITIRNYLENQKNQIEKGYNINIKIKKIIGKYILGSISNEDIEINSGEFLNYNDQSFEIHLIDGDEISLISDKPELMPFSVDGTYPFKKTKTPLFLIQNMLDLLEQIFNGNNNPSRLNKLKKLLLTPNQFEVSSPKEYQNEEYKNDLVNKNINEKQRELILKSVGLLTDEKAYFFLCRGPPGTGKTKCITEIIKKSIDLNKKILITSFTNIAVDNVLKELAKNNNYKDKILRLGHDKSVKIKEVKEITSRTIDPEKLVIGATLDTIGLTNHNNEEFDLVILDESSMIEFPKALLGISKGEKFLMIGDDKQLQPIFKDSEQDYEEDSEYMIQLLGLFNKLMDIFREEFCVNLNTQYRSAPEIINFSNKEFYNGELKSPKDENFNNRIRKYNQWLNLQSFQSLNHIQKKILDPKKTIVFIETSNISNNWSYNSSHCPVCGNKANKNQWKNHCNNCNKEWKRKHVNPTEISIAIKLTEFFCKINNNFTEEAYWKEIGFISPFRKQGSAFRAMLSRTCCKNHPKLKDLGNRNWDDYDYIKWLEYLEEFEVGTVHRSQGREKDFIIFSITHKGGGTARLLNDDHLLNVALTRARNKLIIIGSKEGLQNTKYTRLYESIPKDSKINITDEELKELVSEINEYNEMINNLIIRNIKELPKKNVRPMKVIIPTKYNTQFNQREVDDLIKDKKEFIYFDMKNNGLFDLNTIDKHKDLMEEYKNRGVYDEISFRTTLEEKDDIIKKQLLNERFKQLDENSYLYQSLLKKILILEIFEEIKIKRISEKKVKELIELKNKKLLYSYINIKIFGEYMNPSKDETEEKSPINETKTPKEMIMEENIKIKHFVVGNQTKIFLRNQELFVKIIKVNKYKEFIEFEKSDKKIIIYDFKNKSFVDKNGNALMGYSLIRMV